MDTPGPRIAAIPLLKNKSTSHSLENILAVNATKEEPLSKIHK